jgi:hypothetical protein
VSPDVAVGGGAIICARRSVIVDHTPFLGIDRAWEIPGIRAMAQTDCRPTGHPLEETRLHSAITPRNSFFVPAFLAQFLGDSMEEWRENTLSSSGLRAIQGPALKKGLCKGRRQVYAVCARSAADKFTQSAQGRPQTSLRSLRKVGRRQVYAVCARSKGDIAEQSEQCAVNAS